MKWERGDGPAAADALKYDVSQVEIQDVGDMTEAEVDAIIKAWEDNELGYLSTDPWQILTAAIDYNQAQLASWINEKIDRYLDLKELDYDED